MARINITTPVGRIVQGSLYDPSTTNQQGELLIVKTGANKGQPRVDYWFKLAIPKNQGETHWAQAKAVRADGTINDWGAQIWNVGAQAFPQYAQLPNFSWKIEDGDDATPNPDRKGRRNCDTEGFPGNWIVKFSGGFAPKVYQQEGGSYVQIMQKDFCKPGYFVEVAMSVDSNKNDSKPGVYINHSMVCFRAYGQEISFGPDVASAGFGAAPLPVGASVTPPAGVVPMPTGSAPPPLPPAGSVPMPPGHALTAPAPIPVMPNPGFVQMPPPPAAPVRQMTALATATYEAYIAANWTDAQLVQNGLMLA